MFVEEKIHDAFVEKLVKRAKGRTLGDQFDPDTTQGPQVDKAQFDKILSYIDKGKEGGADCVTGGKRWGKKPGISENAGILSSRDGR